MKPIPKFQMNPSGYLLYLLYWVIGIIKYIILMNVSNSFDYR